MTNKSSSYYRGWENKNEDQETVDWRTLFYWLGRSVCPSELQSLDAAFVFSNCRSKEHACGSDTGPV